MLPLAVRTAGGGVCGAVVDVDVAGEVVAGTEGLFDTGLRLQVQHFAHLTNTPLHTLTVVVVARLRRGHTHAGVAALVGARRQNSTLDRA